VVSYNRTLSLSFLYDCCNKTLFKCLCITLFYFKKKFNTINILTIILIIVFKILTGVSLVLVQQSFKYTKTLMLILAFKATSIKEYVSMILLNLNSFEFDDLLLFKKL